MVRALHGVSQVLAHMQGRKAMGASIRNGLHLARLVPEHQHRLVEQDTLE
jgi:hypothetical protein